MHRPLPAKIKTAIRKLIEERSAPLAVERFEIRIGNNSDGEETIFVDAWHPLNPTPIDVRMLIEIQSSVIRLVLASGDDRLPHVWQHFAEDQEIATATR